MLSIKDILKKFCTNKNIVCGLFVLIVFTLACASRKENLLTAIGIQLTALYVVINFILVWRSSVKKGLTKDSPMLSGLTLSFVTSLASPVVIVN